MRNIKKKRKPKKDRFLSARGGSSKFIIIACAKCGTHVLLYQKDGPGGLLRMYLDRIHAPKSLVDVLYNIKKKSEFSGLKCSKCDALLAVPMVYNLEKRLAYRVIRGTVKQVEDDDSF